jgi:hypothetical protein
MPLLLQVVTQQQAAQVAIKLETALVEQQAAKEVANKRRGAVIITNRIYCSN